MQITNPHYMEGWIDLAKDVQLTLERSIAMNNGAKKTQDVFAVLNDMIGMSHRLYAIQVEYESYVAQEFNGENPEIEERLLYLVVDNSKEE